MAPSRNRSTVFDKLCQIPLEQFFFQKKQILWHFVIGLPMRERRHQVWTKKSILGWITMLKSAIWNLNWIQKCKSKFSYQIITGGQTFLFLHLIKHELLYTTLLLLPKVSYRPRSVNRVWRKSCEEAAGPQCEGVGQRPTTVRGGA